MRAGLTAGEAARLCNEGNIKIAMRDRTVRLKVRFVDYSGVDADAFASHARSCGW